MKTTFDPHNPKVGPPLGALSTAVHAHNKHWATVIPTEAWAGGIAASLVIGAVAGSLPPYQPHASHEPEPCGPFSGVAWLAVP